MYIRLIDNITSKEFHDAVELGDDNSKTLGFLPKLAFQKYAEKGQLIGVFKKNTHKILGYLLYRVSYNKVTIVHLCIDNSERNNGTATKLIDYLKKNTTQYDGIRLSCRNDYGIDSVWEKFNFVPVKEKIGRSKKGLPLTVWWFPHFHNNLLTQISEYEINNKIVAVIDMNIFLDIKEEREVESLALKSDWLVSEAILYFTREMHIEINRAQSNDLKDSSRKLLKYFKELPFKDETHFSQILLELKIKFPLKDDNDKNGKSDLHHIAYSISGGAEFFITRDEELLKNHLFFLKYDLIVCRPSDFITHLDENIQISKYKPQLLIGTNISTKSITTKDINFFTEKFLKPNEKKIFFQKTIRNSLSHPNQFELITISKKDELLGFVVFDRSLDDELNIPIFRFLSNNLKFTLVKHILFKAILTSTNEKRKLISIKEKHIDDDLQNVLKESRFTKIKDVWQKINIKGIINKKDLNSEIEKNENLRSVISNINTNINKSNNTSELVTGYNYERFLSPVKIEDLDIPTYIIPIKPKWAEQLFNDKSKEKFNLFEPEYELLLNRENVYYRSAKPKIINAPARVLWYLSENKSTKAKGSIIAASYIDEIFVDSPKNLFKQFEKLGIYKWKDISRTSGSKKEIMAFVFSDTELFTNYISLTSIKNIYNTIEKKKFMVVTPIQIKLETYLELYKRGMNL